MHMQQSSPLSATPTVKNQEMCWKMNSVKKHNTTFPIFFYTIHIYFRRFD